MRADRPIPGNPWPHEMVITVEDSSDALLSLLWIREAWRLEPEGNDLPPQLIDTPIPVPEPDRASAPITKWQDAWPELWHACLRHAAEPRDPRAFDALHSAEPGSAERARLISELVGPTWDDRFGRDALAHGETEWRSTLIHERLLPFAHSQRPERSALDALIPAWRTGLTSIVQLPCRGSFTRVVGPHALVMTIGTRSDPDRFREALEAFHRAPNA